MPRPPCARPTQGPSTATMARTYRVTEADPDATALVFYPAEALANDQLIRWMSAAEAENVYPESIQQITGDTPMRLREQLLNGATVALVTPDVVHAWPIRTARPPAQKRFPANLRVAVTDGAHVHEDVLGTNAACMFRRLGVATIQAGNRYFIQHNATTATIQSPEEHMQGLTGRTSGRSTSWTMGPHLPHSPAPCAVPPGREKPGTRRIPAPDLDHRQRAPGPGIPLPGPWAECRTQRRHGPPGRFSARRTPPD